MAAALALLGPGAAAASADTLSVAGPAAQRVLVMTGTGTPGNSTVTLGSAAGAGKAYRFTNSAGIDITGPTANLFCDPSGAAVECADDLTPAIADDDIDEVRVDAGAGADTITVLSAFSTTAVTLNGDAGADAITGGPGPERITGGAGDDTIEARDGVTDHLRCDGGTDDVVRADAIDDIDADCENQTIGTPPPVQPPPAPPPPLAPSAQTLSLFPIAIGVSAAFESSSKGSRITRLTVKDVPADVFVHVACSSPSRLAGGARCPFRQAKIHVTSKTSKLALVKRFKGRRLAVHTAIRLYGVAAGRVGSYVRFTVRKRGAPARADGCANALLRRISCLSANP